MSGLPFCVWACVLSGLLPHFAFTVVLLSGSYSFPSRHPSHYPWPLYSSMCPPTTPVWCLAFVLADSLVAVCFRLSVCLLPRLLSPAMVCVLVLCSVPAYSACLFCPFFSSGFVGLSVWSVSVCFVYLFCCVSWLVCLYDWSVCVCSACLFFLFLFCVCVCQPVWSVPVCSVCFALSSWWGGWVRAGALGCGRSARTQAPARTQLWESRVWPCGR